MQGAVEPEVVNVPVVMPIRFQWQDIIATTYEAVTEVATTISSVIDPPQAFTQVPATGSPGPGLRGTGVGARATGHVDSAPWDSAVEGSTPTTLPDSQQPSDAGITLSVIT